MRAKAGKPDAANVSPLETQYRQFFQQTTPDDTVPFINENWLQHPSVVTRLTQTYTTYGAYEKPIEKD